MGDAAAGDLFGAGSGAADPLGGFTDMSSVTDPFGLGGMFDAGLGATDTGFPGTFAGGTDPTTSPMFGLGGAFGGDTAATPGTDPAINLGSQQPVDPAAGGSQPSPTAVAPTAAPSAAPAGVVNQDFNALFSQALGQTPAGPSWMTTGTGGLSQLASQIPQGSTPIAAWSPGGTPPATALAPPAATPVSAGLTDPAAAISSQPPATAVPPGTLGRYAGTGQTAADVAQSQPTGVPPGSLGGYPGSGQTAADVARSQPGGGPVPGTTPETTTPSETQGPGDQAGTQPRQDGAQMPRQAQQMLQMILGMLGERFGMPGLGALAAHAMGRRQFGLPGGYPGVGPNMRGGYPFMRGGYPFMRGQGRYYNPRTGQASPWGPANPQPGPPGQTANQPRLARRPDDATAAPAPPYPEWANPPPADIAQSTGVDSAAQSTGLSAPNAAEAQTTPGTVTNPRPPDTNMVRRSRAAGTNTMPTQGFSRTLQQVRSGIANEVARNPQLRQQLAAMAYLEDADDPVAPIEALANRVNAMNANGHPMTAAQMLRSGFYGPINRGHLPGAMRTLANSPNLMNRMNHAIDTVLRGSNILGGATDQGSPGDPNYGHAGGRVVRGREVYNDWGGGAGHAANARWRMNIQRQVQAEQGRESQVAQMPLSWAY